VCVEGEHSSLAGAWNTCGAPGWSLSGLKTLVLSVFTQAKHCLMVVDWVPMNGLHVMGLTMGPHSGQHGWISRLKRAVES